MASNITYYSLVRYLPYKHDFWSGRKLYKSTDRLHKYFHTCFTKRNEKSENECYSSTHKTHDFDLDKIVDLNNLMITKDNLKETPVRWFPGDIHVIKQECNEQNNEIQNVIDKLKQEKVLGFDMEMTESYGGYHNISNTKRCKRTRVAQIASKTDAIVWQLKNYSTLPQSLVSFLKSDILKVGHAISDDVVLLKKEFNLNSKNIFDTLPWAIELQCSPLGLHAMCALFLGWRISKGLRTSDWNRYQLSDNQIHYACTDAWASLMLYNKMMSVAQGHGRLSPDPIACVNEILQKRLKTKRQRRARLIKNNKARKQYKLMAQNAMYIIE